MKRVCFPLFLTMFGIANLDAQASMQRDSSKLLNATMQRESSNPSKSTVYVDNGKSEEKRVKNDIEQM